MSNQVFSHPNFSHPVIYETASHKFEVKEASLFVKILQVLHLGKLFRYYSPTDKNAFLKKVDSFSKNMLDQNIDAFSCIQSYRSILSLKKTFSLLPSSEESRAINDACQSSLNIKKESFVKPSSIILPQHFKQNPQEAASSFLFLMRNCAQEKILKDEFSYFAQQLINLFPDKENIPDSANVEPIAQIIYDFLKNNKYSKDIKLHVVNNLLPDPVTENLIPFFTITLQLSLRNEFAKPATMLDFLTRLISQEFLKSIDSYPPFETALDWFSPLLNNVETPHINKAIFLCGLLKFFKPPSAQSNEAKFTEQYCSDFFKDLFSSSKLTNETKKGILLELKTFFQNKTEFFLKSIVKNPLESKFTDNFLIDSKTETYKFFNFPIIMLIDLEKSLPIDVFQTFVLTLLKNESTPLSVKIQTADALFSEEMFPRPEMEIQHWKKIISEELVNGLSI